jgi:protein-disulfide isomerase
MLAERAQAKLKPHSPAWLRADDILSYKPPIKRRWRSCRLPRVETIMNSRFAAFAVVGALAIGGAYLAGIDLGAETPAGAEELKAGGMTAAAPAPATPVIGTTGFNDDQRAEIEGIIRGYLISHPEIIKDAITELQRREDVAAQATQAKVIADNTPLLFSSKHQVVLGNPNGDVTLVEFFDYNCTYCRRAHADMKQLLAEDKNLRVVLKEFPVLGQGSVEAAQVGVAVNILAPEKYGEFHDRLIGSKGQINGARALAVAEELGLDPTKVKDAMSSDVAKATINEAYDLAGKLALTGTPSYVTAKEVVVGAVGYDALKQKIATLRCGQPSC